MVMVGGTPKKLRCVESPKRPHSPPEEMESTRVAVGEIDEKMKGGVTFEPEEVWMNGDQILDGRG
jgi:hypothetical protein